MPPCEAGCILESISLNASYFLGIGTTIKPGAKDGIITRSGQPRPFLEVIRELSGWPVLLYDTQSERGWLIDAARAALHILRFLVGRYESVEGSSFRIEDFKYADPTKGGAEAVAKLNENRNLVLLSDQDLEDATKIVETTVGKKVNNVIVDYFEQMLATLSKAKKERWSIFLPNDKSKLEGWRFGDIVQEKRHIEAVACKIDSTAEHWHRFIRQINAIVLFGKWFGEIIRPSSDVCQAFETLPLKQGCIAVSVPLLRYLIGDNGDMDVVPILMTPGLWWHLDKDPFTCQCRSQPPGTDHICTRIQELSDSEKSKNPAADKILKKIRDPGQYENAAIIFGKRWKR